MYLIYHSTMKQEKNQGVLEMALPPLGKSYKPWQNGYMKTLYLLRHAKSDYPNGISDHERPLNGRGKKACQFMGHYVRERGIAPEVILSSDAQRTRQTATLLLREAGITTPVQYLARLYLATPGEILKELAKLPGNTDSVLAIGHNPGIEQLAAWLCHSGDADALTRLKTKYPTCGLATIRLDATGWKQLDPGSGVLESFITPAKN